ncbi:hypothetical protein [Microbacterium sp. NPDC055683]
MTRSDHAPITALSPDSPEGMYQISTLSGAKYLLEIHEDSANLRRFAASGSHEVDIQTVQLITFDVEVGERATFVFFKTSLRIRVGTYGGTWRWSTAVQKIERTSELPIN